MSTTRDLIAPLGDGKGILLFDEFVPGQHRGLPTSGFHWAIEDPDLGLLELTCANGYVVTDYDLGFPEVREVTYNRPLNDGTFDLSRYVGARLVSLTITLDNEFGGTAPFGIRGSNSKMRTRLAAYMHPSRRPILSFVEDGWDVRRRVVVRGRAPKMVTSRVNANVIQAHMVVPSGLIESYNEHSAQVEVSDLATDHIVEVHNAGDVDAHWAVSMMNLSLAAAGGAGVQGAGIELALDPNGPNQHSLKMMLDLDPAETLRVFSSDKSAIIESATGVRRTVFQHVDRTSDWWQLPFGDHRFGFWVLDSSGRRITPPPEARRAVWGPFSAADAAARRTRGATEGAWSDLSKTYPTVAAHANLAALVAGVIGDDLWPDGAFRLGDYVRLVDGSDVYYLTAGGSGNWYHGHFPGELSPVSAGPGDLSLKYPKVAGFADFDSLKVSPRQGDGVWAGAAMLFNQYVLLGDGNEVHYQGGVWAEGPVPDAPQPGAPGDVTASYPLVAAHPDLLTLTTSPGFGMGSWPGTMNVGEFIVLGDGSHVHHRNSGWAVGPYPQPDLPGDVTALWPLVAAYYSLDPGTWGTGIVPVPPPPDLSTSTTQGDGVWTGTMTTTEYIVLGDGSHVYYLIAGGSGNWYHGQYPNPLPTTPADAYDRSIKYPKVAGFATLDTLKVSPREGDGVWAGTMTDDEYVALANGQKVHWLNNYWHPGPHPPAGDPNDLSLTYPKAAALANIEALRIHPTQGDGWFTGSFSWDQYIVLADGEQVHYGKDVWHRGAHAASPWPVGDGIDVTASYPLVAAYSSHWLLSVSATQGNGVFTGRMNPNEFVRLTSGIHVYYWLDRAGRGAWYIGHHPDPATGSTGVFPTVWQPAGEQRFVWSVDDAASSVRGRNRSTEFGVVAAFADLPTLKASPTAGDGNWPGGFPNQLNPGDWIVLADGSLTHYSDGFWWEGPRPSSGGVSFAQITYFDTWVD